MGITGTAGYKFITYFLKYFLLNTITRKKSIKIFDLVILNLIKFYYLVRLKSFNTHGILETSQEYVVENLQPIC